jgi:uncharacterized membrane protein YgdD (TMEM256/DUF423 family)
MHKNFLRAGALFGAIAIALGAFGAHGLEQVTQDEKILHSFHTGVQYQMYHALALLAVGILYEKLHVKQLVWAGWSFIAGVFLFSGSLYLITFLKVQGSGFAKVAGPVTPLGGVMFILGWIFLGVGILKKK